MVAFNDDIRCYVNNGSQSFSQHTIASDALDASSLYSIDLDGDGDLDVLSSSITDGKIAWYENAGTVGVDEEVPFTLVKDFHLNQNYPNPFNPVTVISWQLAVSSQVRLVVYDLSGKEVAELVNEERKAGSHRVQFDGSSLASGIYLYRLQAGQHLETKKMILLK